MTKATTTAKRAAAKKPAAKKPAAKVVRHGTVKRTTGTSSSRTGASLGIDRETLLKKLVKLSNSKQDAVALDATKALLTYVK